MGLGFIAPNLCHQMRRLAISEISETGNTEPTMCFRQSQPVSCFQTREILTKMTIVGKDLEHSLLTVWPLDVLSFIYVYLNSKFLNSERPFWLLMHSEKKKVMSWWPHKFQHPLPPPPPQTSTVAFHFPVKSQEHESHAMMTLQISPSPPPNLTTFLPSLTNFLIRYCSVLIEFRV